LLITTLSIKNGKNLTYKLAVYGTLKRGHNNHHYINGAKYLGEAHLGKGYGLVVDGLPFLVEDKDGPGCYIELYEITEQQLAACDKLEGHPTFYIRRIVSVFELETGHEVKAQCYIYPNKEQLRELGSKLQFTRRY
jgi:gamma-glutamylaminecyclotransferase